MTEQSEPQSSTDRLDAHLEDEIQQALGDMSFDELLDADGPSQTSAPTVDPKATPTPEPRSRPSRGGRHHHRRGAPKRRDERITRVGTVMALHGDNALVEFDAKTQGLCPGNFFKEPPKIGEELEFILDHYDNDESLWLLARKGEVRKADWELLEVGQIVEARCTGTNKGGLDMEIANHKAFMPAGQVALRHIDELDVFIGEKMPCEVIELDRQRGRIILSRKSHLMTERSELRGKLLEELEVGQTRDAVITSVQPYGAFADLGGVDGLIHVSDLSHQRVKHPSEVVKEGQQVTVTVLKMSGSGDDLKIGLGMKQLEDDPFTTTINELTEGATVSGRVTRIATFGAFVELAPGVEGLVHISELAHERINRVNQVVKEDEVVTAQVLSVDPDSRRIALSLKALKDSPQAQEANLQRKEDPHLRKLKAMLGTKFGDDLKGGLS